jgi:uncharacterized FlgJ-related protein
MFNISNAVTVIRANAAKIAAENARRLKQGIDAKLQYGEGRCAHYVKEAISSSRGGTLVLKDSDIESAKDYGPCLIKNGFKVVERTITTVFGGVYNIAGQQVGDVVVIAAAPDHIHGHMAMFDGTNWVSDFVQTKGFYPAQIYRKNNTSYVLYRYVEETTNQADTAKDKIPNIRFIIPQNNTGTEFAAVDDILNHLDGESSGLYMIGRNGMWHGGIHISSVTTPWCALSGKAESEKKDFPTPFKGEQYLRCMADGEVVAYRICKDYMTAPWITGTLNISGSFVLIRHHIQLGEKKESGLTFYTMYMHLAPWSAYQSEDDATHWITTDKLSAYSPEWIFAATSGTDGSVYRLGTLPKGKKVTWDSKNTGATQESHNRQYGCVTLEEDAGKFKKGDQVWILVDKDNVKSVTTEVPRPAWWAGLKEKMVFEKVTCPEPYPIKAGDAIGHLGYFQNPTRRGYDPCYQAHIECFTADENLLTFLTNPEKLDRDKPQYVKYVPGLKRYGKNISTLKLELDEKPTRSSGIATLSKLKIEKDDAGKEYYQIFAEQGYLKKEDLKFLSQYDLKELGFTIIEDNPTTFDHLDGETPPRGLVRTLLEFLLDTSKNDTRFSHALVPHNYQRLLNMIDTNKDGYYSADEYRQAIHNRSYRDQLYRIIAKHPSEWYFKPTDSLWSTFLKKMFDDAPHWTKYCETVIEKLGWMQEAKKTLTEKTLEAKLWHMHPVVFLDSFSSRKIIDWTKLTKQEFVDIVYEEALKEEAISGIPAAVTTAQAVEESGYGKKVMVDINSGKYSYNLFGIKAKTGQDYVENWTSEEVNGKKIKIIDKFACYQSFKESIAGRSNFLKSNPRYSSLFESSDPIEWAKGLQEKGYATNSNYASNLIGIMKGRYMKGRGLK